MSCAPRSVILPALLGPACAAAETSASVPATAGALVQPLLALGVVVAAILAAAWVIKRLQGAPTGTSALVRPLAAVPVGPRERIVLVEVQDTWLVLGVAQGGVTMLHSMPRSETPALARTPDGGFAGWLARARTARATER